MRSRGSPFALLQSCDNSCIIAKEKKQTMSFDQALSCDGELFVLELLLLLLLLLLLR